MSLMTELPKYWMDGAVRALDGRRRGLSDHYPLSEDPPGVTPYEVVYEGGKVKLRHYAAQGKRASHAAGLRIRADQAAFHTRYVSGAQRDGESDPARIRRLHG